MAAITFKRGEFQVFRATTQIHLGAISKDVFPDDEFEFDGQTFKYAGEQHSLPSIRMGIQEGWFVPAEDTTTQYRSKSAGVQVRPATAAGSERGAPMTVEAASHEETVVASVDDHKERVEKGIVRQPRKVAAQPTTQRPAPASDSKEARMAALRAELAALEAEEATPAPDPEVEAALTPEPPPPAPDLTDTLGSRAEPVPIVKPNRQLSVEEADEINRRILDAERSKVVPPKKEHPSEETTTQGGFQVVSEDQGGVPVKTYKFSTPAGREGDARNVAGTDITRTTAAAVDASVRPVAETPRREVPASSTQVPAEGNTDINMKLEGGATGDVAEAVSGEQLTELMGKTAAAAGPDVSNPLKWDTNLQWKSRVKKAVEEYGQDPDALRQILAVESPAVRKHIGIQLKKLHGK